MSWTAEETGRASGSMREGAAAELRDWLCEASIVAAESPPAVLADSRLLLAARELAPPPRFFRRRRRPPGAVTIMPLLGLQLLLLR